MSTDHRRQLYDLITKHIGEAGPEASDADVANAIMATFDTTCNTSPLMTLAAYAWLHSVVKTELLCRQDRG